MQSPQDQAQTAPSNEVITTETHKFVRTMKEIGKVLLPLECFLLKHSRNISNNALNNSLVRDTLESFILNDSFNKEEFINFLERESRLGNQAFLKSPQFLESPQVKKFVRTMRTIKQTLLPYQNKAMNNSELIPIKKMKTFLLNHSTNISNKDLNNSLVHDTLESFTSKGSFNKEEFIKFLDKESKLSNQAFLQLPQVNKFLRTMKEIAEQLLPHRELIMNNNESITKNGMKSILLNISNKITRNDLNTSHVNDTLESFTSNGSFNTQKFIKFLSNELHRGNSAFRNLKSKQNVLKKTTNLNEVITSAQAQAQTVNGGKKVRKSTLKKNKKVRKHKGIYQTGPKKGKLKPGFKYSGKKTKTGLKIIIKVKK